VLSHRESRDERIILGQLHRDKDFLRQVAHLLPLSQIIYEFLRQVDFHPYWRTKGGSSDTGGRVPLPDRKVDRDTFRIQRFVFPFKRNTNPLCADINYNFQFRVLASTKTDVRDAGREGRQWKDGGDETSCD
jgi:hypothetical protein